MNENRSSNKRRQKNQGLGSNEWLVVGGGSIVAIALLGFALVRSNRSVPLPAPASSATASSVTSTQLDEEAAVRRITHADLRAAMDRGQVMVIDVRDLDSYKAGHIAGSYQIPVSAIENEVQYLPRGKMIVTYCT